MGARRVEYEASPHGRTRSSRGAVAVAGAVVSAITAMALGVMASLPPLTGQDDEAALGPQMRIITETRPPGPPARFEVAPEAPLVLPTPAPGLAPTPAPLAGAADPYAASGAAAPESGSAAEPSAPSVPAFEAAPAAPVRASFDCARVRDSLAEMMVCDNEALAAADRRLDRAYRRAMRRADDRAALRREQIRWLGAREDAAETGPGALAEAYAARTDELDRYY